MVVLQLQMNRSFWFAEMVVLQDYLVVVVQLQMHRSFGFDEVVVVYVRDYLV